MTKKIDVDVVLDVLQGIVDDFGEDYKYTDHYGSCQYVDHSGEPACILGHVLSRLGLPTPEPDSLENFIDWNGALSNVRKFRSPFAPKANQALVAVQRIQDGGMDINSTWGAALAFAKNEYA